jgi:hypothetical protein
MEISIQLRIARIDKSQCLAYSLPGARLFHLIRTTVNIPTERQSLICIDSINISFIGTGTHYLAPEDRQGI